MPKWSPYRVNAEIRRSFHKACQGSSRKSRGQVNGATLAHGVLLLAAFDRELSTGPTHKPD